MSWTRAVRAGLMGMGVLAAFTPLTLRSDGGASRATAVCATCCSQPGAACVICGTVSCAKVKDYYEGKVGPGGCIAET